MCGAMLPASRTVSVATQESFGQLVRRYRRDALLTQEALAERAGISVRAVQGIEAGSKHQPRSDTLRLLMEALAVTEDEQGSFLAAAGQVALQGRSEVYPASRLQTFLVADIRGYTRFTVEQGDAAAAQLATHFAELAQDVV